MNVGDYVRTDDGLIGKIISEPYEYKDSIGCDIDFGNNDIYNEYEMYQNIIKSSPNIIDLIEEHDILKIEEQKDVYTICEVEEFRDPYVNYKFLGVRLENQSRVRKLYELNIKSIVTKEQFESMEYKL